jgi:hypothetical protein
MDWRRDKVLSLVQAKPGGAGAPAASDHCGGRAVASPGRVAAKVAAALDQSVLLTLIETFEGVGQLPKDVDRQLLAGGRSAIGRDLGPTEKKSVRDLFLAMCRDRLAR